MGNWMLHFIFSFISLMINTFTLNRKVSAVTVAKSLQLCPTLWDPIDGSPPGSTVPGILQARTLEWVAISFSKVWKWKVKVKSLSRVRLFPTPWTAAYQAPPSIGFSRQEYWSGLPLSSPKFLLDALYSVTMLRTTCKLYGVTGTLIHFWWDVYFEKWYLKVILWKTVGSIYEMHTNSR